MNKYVITTFCLLSPPVLLLSLFFFLSVLAHPSSCLILQTLVKQKKQNIWKLTKCDLLTCSSQFEQSFFHRNVITNANVSLRLFILFLSDISELSVVNGAVILHGFLCWNGCTDAQISSDCILNKPDGSRWKIMSWFVAVLLFSDSHYMC